MSFRNISINALKEGLFDHAAQKPFYLKGQATDKIENTVLFIFVKGGSAQVLLPPEEGLDEKLNSRFDFGQKFFIEDTFDIEDIKISIYNGELSIKIFATLKEDFL